MNVDAIGRPLETTTEQSQSINQEEFIKLFLAQLRAQDPTEPLKNEEFLAQMAQFASLEQSRIFNQNLESLNYMTSTAQATNLLGKEVSVNTPQGQFATSGVVTAIEFDQNGARLTVLGPNNTPFRDVRLSQISLVRRDTPDANQDVDATN